MSTQPTQNISHGDDLRHEMIQICPDIVAEYDALVASDAREQYELSLPQEVNAEQEDDDDAEPEDDFNAAWEVLDLARAIFEKQKDESDEVKLKLAEVFITLGDVSLETGAFVTLPYARSTYQTSPLLPFREIRPSHFRLHGRPRNQGRTPSPLLATDRRGALQVEYCPRPHVRPPRRLHHPRGARAG